MGTKPPDWDPVHPKDRICIFCYDPAPYYAVWKYGVNCVCYQGKCKNRTLGMIGLKFTGGRFTQGGLFRVKSEAERHFELEQFTRREKEPNSRG